METKSLYIKTFGCQMNETDSERILHLFQSMGFIEAEDPFNADVIIINSCSVREKAEHKLMSLIGRLLKIKERNRDVRIGVCGCTVQKDHDDIIRKFSGIDFVFGTYDIPDAYNIYEKSLKTACYAVSDVPKHSLDEIRQYKRKIPHKAFVTIMEGCDNFCSFCIIPFVRGRERSRPKESIIGEIRLLREKGVKEITLIGQNVNRYNHGGCSFPGLLREIAGTGEIERIRFITSHPRDIGEDLFEVFSQNDNICNSIHLPVQSGSDRILSLMNRGYTHDEYIKKIKRFREFVPDLIITTDIIVGFPTETEDDFSDTLRLVEEACFWGAFSFKYSVRHPTEASRMEDDVPIDIKFNRLYRLQKRQNDITMGINRGFLGQTHRVLVDGLSKKSDDVYMGKNEFNITVNIRSEGKKGPLIPGEFADVKIDGFSNNSLIGNIL